MKHNDIPFNVTTMWILIAEQLEQARQPYDAQKQNE